MLWGILAGAIAALSPITDVRVGDAGNTARVEIVCAGPCEAEPFSDNAFLIRAQSQSFTASLQGRSQWLRTLRVTQTPSGAALDVDPLFPPRSVTAQACGENRICFDFAMRAAPEPLRRPAPAVQTRILALGEDLDALTRQSGLDVRTTATMALVAPDDGRCAEARRRLAADPSDLWAYRMASTCPAAPAGTEYSMDRTVPNGMRGPRAAAALR